VQRRAVLVAISRVHLAQLAMEQPPAVGQTSENMSNTLARDLVEALNSLLDAQNRFMAIWVDHYGMRSALCLDLGIMQLDENGVWLDPESVRESDYNQLVSGENEDMGMVLPAAPLPGGNMPRLAPGVPDVDGMIYPQELRQAPPAPKALAPSEMLPSGVTPPGTTVPATRIPPTYMAPAPTDFTPVVPKPSTLSGFPVEPDTVDTPVETNVTYQNPIQQRRLPSATLLKNYGTDSVQQLPDIDESVDVTTEDESSVPISTTSTNTSRTITFHAAQLGAGQTLQNDSAPISVASAQSRSLPVPYSPNSSSNASPASRAATTIEQVGYRPSIATDNLPTPTANQNKTVVSINNAQTR